MRKIAFVFAAFAVALIVSAPVSSAFAAPKKEKTLYQGWVEEMKKAAKVK